MSVDVRVQLGITRLQAADKESREIIQGVSKRALQL
jgi:hypothetical protein